MHLRKSCVITGCTSEPNCYSIVVVCVLSINEDAAEDNYKINDASDSATINIIYMIPIESACANDNGAYIRKGTSKRLFL